MSCDSGFESRFLSLKKPADSSITYMINKSQIPLVGKNEPVHSTFLPTYC